MTFFERDGEWAEWYVGNKMYLDGAGYVQSDGTKMCALCKKVKYAVEFIDLVGGLQDDFELSYKADVVLGDPEDDYFVDRLLPVCHECVRMRTAKKDGKYKKDPRGGLIGRDVLRMCEDLSVVCDRCGNDTQLADLMMMTSRNEVGKRCQACAKKQIADQIG